MYTFEKAELTTSMRYIVIFLKSAIPNFNSEVSDTVGRKTKRTRRRRKRRKRRRTQIIAKGYAFYANAERCINIIVLSSITL